AQKEDAGAEAVDRLAELEIVEHRQLGVADVDAVDPRQDPQEGEERDQSPRDLRVDAIDRADRGLVLERLGDGIAHGASFAAGAVDDRTPASRRPARVLESVWWDQLPRYVAQLQVVASIGTW